MSRKRKLDELFTDEEEFAIKELQLDTPVTEDNLKSCLLRLKNDKNITRLCRKILYLSGLSSPSKKYKFNYALSQYSRMQNNLGKIITILYLLYKNPEDCFVLHQKIHKTLDFTNLSSMPIEKTEIVLKYINVPWVKSYIVNVSFPPNFKQQLEACSNKRFTMIFLSHFSIDFDSQDELNAYKDHYENQKNKHISYTNSKFYKTLERWIPDKASAHQNALIIDNKNKTIERFEPHGAESNYVMRDIDNAIVSGFMRELNLSAVAYYTDHPDGHKDADYTFISPIDFCPANSLQVLEQNDPLKTQIDFQGYCYMWTIFYMELRMTKPDIPRDQLIQRTIDHIKNSKNSFKDYIYDYIFYHTYIINTVEESIKELQSKKYFKYLPKKVVSFIITNKIKEVGEIYSGSIFQDVNHKSKNNSHLSKLKSFIRNRINSVFLKNEKLDPEIVRRFDLAIEEPNPKRRKLNKGGKRKIRKHKGINQQTGKLKPGYKYSGKTLKSGLKQIIKL